MKPSHRIDGIVGANIRAAMAEADTTMVALSKATGIPRETLRQQVNGEASMRVEVMVLCADALGLDPAALLLDTPEPLRPRRTRRRNLRVAS